MGTLGEVERNGTPKAGITEDLGVLRFITAGSVDDGKSTLIGRLLHDTKAIFEDQLAAVSRASSKRGQGEMEARSSWRRPKEISHLAWGCLAQGTAMLSYTQLGMLVLDIFLGLTAMHPTRTPTGALIHPMPTPKKVC